MTGFSKQLEETWTRHLKEDKTDNKDDIRRPTSPPNQKEILAINSLKNGKCKGADGVRAEDLK